MKKPVKIIFAALVLLAAGAYGLYAYTRPFLVETVLLAPQTVAQSFTEPGVVKGGQVYTVYAPVSGVVSEVTAAEGQRVKAGDTLFCLDDAQYQLERQGLMATIAGYHAQQDSLHEEEERYRDDLRVSISRLKGELNTLQAQKDSAALSLEEQTRLQQLLIDQNEEEYLYAYKEWENISTLYEEGVISKSEADNAYQALEALGKMTDQSKQQMEVILSGKADAYHQAMEASLVDQLTLLEKNLEKGGAAAMGRYYESLIAGAEASLEKLNRQIQEHVVKAPIDGVLKMLAAESANLIAAGTPAAQILPEEHKEIEVFVSTREIHEVKIGDPVLLTLKRQEEDETCTGVVTAIAGEAEVKLSSLGLEERRVKVTLQPDAKAEAQLGPGFDVDVRFTTYEEENRLAVPKTAVFTDPETDKDYVWVIREGLAVKTQVEKGRALRTDTVILSGLSAGDEVVRDAGHIEIKEGVKLAGR